ncbi:DUF397 domain-containing protein [Streptomyces sp. NRRL F-5065]|uniref:DUF397 domain-containing protein n=1 Tax=Streptomyces sp. NRRL F-5065 TaxID=1463855 RepID=UPI0004C1B262|nr:DUF397 domain-containing protein [Streptomyces sp. NRRL F-5065]
MQRSNGNDPHLGAWRKSTYSNPDGADCVEVADHMPGFVPVRDSKNPQGPVLLIGARAWAPFLSGLKSV